MLNQDGWFILEHTPRNNYENHPKFNRSKSYGTTIFSIFINDNKEEIISLDPTIEN